jgi:hypothetical protein
VNATFAMGVHLLSRCSTLPEESQGG